MEWRSIDLSWRKLEEDTSDWDDEDCEDVDDGGVEEIRPEPCTSDTSQMNRDKGDGDEKLETRGVSEVKKKGFSNRMLTVGRVARGRGLWRMSPVDQNIEKYSKIKLLLSCLR